MNTRRHSGMITMAAVVMSLFVLTALAQPAHADYTRTMRLLQKFGTDCDNGCNYKILAQSYETGNQFFVWYYRSLELNDGQDVVITFNRWDEWIKISNLLNGKESNIHKVVKVE